MRKVSDEMATLEPLRSPLGLLKVLITVSANLDEDDDGETRGKRKTREKERDRQSERESINHHCSTDGKFLLSGCFRADASSAKATKIQTAREQGFHKSNISQFSSNQSPMNIGCEAMKVHLGHR